MDQMVVGHSTSCSDHHSWLHKDHEQHLRDSQVFNQDMNIFGHVSAVEDFTGQPPTPLNHPPKNYVFFEVLRKLQKFWITIIESETTNIDLFLVYYVVAVVKFDFGRLRDVGGWPVDSSLTV
jgi:hypothetical protein